MPQSAGSKAQQKTSGATDGSKSQDWRNVWGLLGEALEVCYVVLMELSSTLKFKFQGPVVLLAVLRLKDHGLACVQNMADAYA
jgi:hypothetical protein